MLYVAQNHRPTDDNPVPKENEKIIQQIPAPLFAKMHKVTYLAPDSDMVQMTINQNRISKKGVEL